MAAVVAGNGLNSPHSAEKEGAAERQQSTMPPNVPIRKDKKDIPVSSEICFCFSIFSELEMENKLCYTLAPPAGQFRCIGKLRIIA